MLRSVLVGLFLAGVTVFIHAVGTSRWIQSLQRRSVRAARPRPAALITLLATAGFVLLLHIAEVLVWAVAFVLLPGTEEITTFADGVYFSIVNFTTLGYGDVTLGHPWRLLGGIEAMNGIVLFGWTAAMLFAVVQKIWKDASADA